MTRIALTLIAFAVITSGWPVAVKALGENAVHSSLADQLKLAQAATISIPANLR